MKTQAIVLGIALVFGLFFIPATSAEDFTCAQLVELGIIEEFSIRQGTIYLPTGYIQIDGCLFDTTEEDETGTFYGEAYNTTRHATGTFYGSGY